MMGMEVLGWGTGLGWAEERAATVQLRRIAKRVVRAKRGVIRTVPVTKTVVDTVATRKGCRLFEVCHLKESCVQRHGRARQSSAFALFFGIGM